MRKRIRICRFNNFKSQKHVALELSTFHELYTIYLTKFGVSDIGSDNQEKAEYISQTMAEFFSLKQRRDFCCVLIRESAPIDHEDFSRGTVIQSESQLQDIVESIENPLIQLISIEKTQFSVFDNRTQKELPSPQIPTRTEPISLLLPQCQKGHHCPRASPFKKNSFL